MQKKIFLFTIILLLFSANIFLQAEIDPDSRFHAKRGFLDFLQKFEPLGLKEKLSPLEIAEINKITFEQNEPVFKGDLATLYFIASGITESTELAKYLKAFDALEKKFRLQWKQQIRRRPKLNNHFHLAESLLHFLHSHLFKVESTGSGAGYNVGIKETFDENIFNCFKSALIYNAMLKRLGVKGRFVSVPEHIFSEILVDGKYIPVETTNRYGFDPFNSMQPKYTRFLDSPNVTFNRKTYPTQTIKDEISVLVYVFNNRALVYGGTQYYSGLKVEKDMDYAVMLLAIASYLMPAKNNFIHENLVSFVYRRFESEWAKRKPFEVPLSDFLQFREKQADYAIWYNHKKFNDHFPYYYYKKDMEHNYQIILYEWAQKIRQKEYAIWKQGKSNGSAVALKKC